MSDVIGREDAWWVTRSNSCRVRRFRPSAELLESREERTGIAQRCDRVRRVAARDEPSQGGGPPALPPAGPKGAQVVLLDAQADPCAVAPRLTPVVAAEQARPQRRAVLA